MYLKEIETPFIEKLTGIYPREEARNILLLIIEHLTGINLRQSANRYFGWDADKQNAFIMIEKRLLQNEPIQYILKEAWFYDAPFYVDKNVLIPRPETEELVHWIIRDAKALSKPTILDIGTGSGCIPIILKTKLPQSTVYACDISQDALNIAQQNAHKLKAAISFIKADILKPTEHVHLPKVDIIVSNPPYIPLSDKLQMRANVTVHEPSLALFVPDEDPLLFYKAIAGFAQTHLSPGGNIYLEIHEAFSKEVLEIFLSTGFSANVKTDMQGKDRMIKCQRR
ncbi:MAG: peptide chain release factor N(5)-glutamine methyltransferase [Niabella sp.]